MHGLLMCCLYLGVQGKLKFYNSEYSLKLMINYELYATYHVVINQNIHGTSS